MDLKVSIVECHEYDSELVYNAVKESLKKIDFKINPKQRVLIKPNVLGQHKPEKCITTHPAVIDAIIRLFKEKDCQIIIAESSGVFMEGGTNKALVISGMKSLSEKYNVKLINLESIPANHIDDSNAKVYKNLEMPKIFSEVDLVVNVPKLKTHMLMKYTGAVKNLFGVIPGGRKQILHSIGNSEPEFGQILVDIYKNIKPGLNIMDGIIGLEGNGPGTEGTPKKTGLILASESAPAMDIVASEIIGFQSDDIYTNKYCIERGFATVDGIVIIGHKPKIPYKRPLTAPSFTGPILGWIMSKAAMRPYAIKKKCKRCAVCKKVCPVKAIELKPYPKIDKKLCIRCYCCHENCPYAAMDLKGIFIIDVLRKIKNKILSKKCSQIEK